VHPTLQPPIRSARDSHRRSLAALTAAVALLLGLGACGQQPPPLAIENGPAPSPTTAAPGGSVQPPVAGDSPGLAGSSAAPGAAAGGPLAPDVPRVVALDPPQGATEVDPARGFLAVTFDRPMDPQGWSWVTEGAHNAPQLGNARFDDNARTNTVEARLEPGRTYVVWINSDRWSYFRSALGVPAAPLRWEFSTRVGAGEPATAAAPSGSAAASAPAPAADPAPDFALLSPHSTAPAPGGPAPRVVVTDPPNGARDVDPATTVLRATYDRPMRPSWSWVREGNDFPETTGQAYFEPDQRTAALPVRLAPGRRYVLWLNRAPYTYFTDLAGTTAEPFRWEFWTRGDAATSQSPAAAP
jgi:hypothetical protein